MDCYLYLYFCVIVKPECTEGNYAVEWMNTEAHFAVSSMIYQFGTLWAL